MPNNPTEQPTTWLIGSAAIRAQAFLDCDSTTGKPVAQVDSSGVGRSASAVADRTGRRQKIAKITAPIVWM